MSHRNWVVVETDWCYVV